MVLKNMTHLLPLDLITNASFKRFEKRKFTEYFTSCIMRAFEIELDHDVVSIEVNLRLSTLKARHAKAMMKLYEYLQTEAGKQIIKAGWKASGITDNLGNARQSNINPIKDNPFK